MIRNALIPARRRGSLRSRRWFQISRMHTNPACTLTLAIRLNGRSILNSGRHQAVGPNSRSYRTLIYICGFTYRYFEGGATGSVNGSYTGTGNNNLLSAGANLPPGGRITVKIKTKVNNVGIHLNQATGSGPGMPDGGVRTDTYDNTRNNQTVGPYNISCPASDCLDQGPWHTNGDSEPTGISLLVPSSAPASIAGRTQYADGVGVGSVQIVMTRVSDGTLWTALSNAFGYFSFQGIPTGQTYVLTISTKRHRFPIETQTINLTDDVTGIVFIAEGGTEVLGGKSLLTQTQSEKSVMPQSRRTVFIKNNKK